MKKIKNIVILAIIAVLASCGATQKDAGSSLGETISPQEFQTKIAIGEATLLDVRTPDEYATNHIKGANNVNVREASFGDKIALLDKTKPVLVYCKSGNRSSTAKSALQTLGYTVYELEGGVLNWQSKGLPLVVDLKNPITKFTMAGYNEIIAANDVVLVDFYATWCGPCKMMAPHIEAMKKKYGDKLVILKVDTDKSPEVSSHFNINAIPLVKIYKGGKEVYDKTGYHNAEQLEGLLANHL
jgi:thioredoxin